MLQLTSDMKESVHFPHTQATASAAPVAASLVIGPGSRTSLEETVQYTCEIHRKVRWV